MHTAASLPEAITATNVAVPTPEQLPDDLGTLKRMIVELVVTLHAERRDKEAMRQRITLLLHRLYGSKSERFNPDQALLFPEGVLAQANDPATSPAGDVAPTEPSSAANKKKKRTPHGRRLLPAALTRPPLRQELS